MLGAKKIVEKLSNLKTLPHVVLRVMQLVNDEHSTMYDFEEIIKLDPVLVARLLRLVNSPYFGLSQKVESISKAVIFIGMKQLRNLVIVDELQKFYKSDADDKYFSREKLWLHAATVAILTEMIATRIFGQKGEDAFLAGIIHDIGLLVEDQVVGGLLRQACQIFQNSDKTFVECEKQIIGTNHVEVGSLLLRNWKLPDEVLKAIRFHHTTNQEYPVSSMISILQLAEYMANKLQYSPVAGYIEPLSSFLVRHVKSKTIDYKIIVRDFSKEIVKAKELYELV